MTSVSTYLVDTIKETGEFDVINGLFNIKESVVSGVKMSGVSETVCLGSKDNKPIFFISKGNSKVYNAGDIIIATIDISSEYTPDATGKITIPDNKKGTVKVSVFSGEMDGKAAQQIESIEFDTTK